MCFNLNLVFWLKAINTQRNAARRLEEEIANGGVPLDGDQVPPLKEDDNDDQVPINLLLLTDGDIRAALFQMAQAITSQAQAVTTQA